MLYKAERQMKRVVKYHDNDEVWSVEYSNILCLGIKVHLPWKVCNSDYVKLLNGNLLYHLVQLFSYLFFRRNDIRTTSF